MVQNAQIKSDKHTVSASTWSGPRSSPPTASSSRCRRARRPSAFLPATVDSATYFDKLYAFPTDSDGGLLYYRKDLLDDAGLEPPRTWAEMKAACDKVRTGGNAEWTATPASTTSSRA